MRALRFCKVLAARPDNRHTAPNAGGNTFMKLLVAEDEPKTGTYLQQGLSEAGFTVDRVENGTDAAQHARDRRAAQRGAALDAAAQGQVDPGGGGVHLAHHPEPCHARK